ncbi:MAG: Flp pilus assembly protein CpaB [Nocardioides sp.]
MDRRRILLVVAVVVALLGTALVYLYVRGADARANDRFDTVNVLRAVAPIEAGETIEDAASNGKLALEPVARDYLLPNYQTSVEALNGSVATVRILPGEQIVSDKFGDEVESGTGGLVIPKGMLAISVSLTDTGRVAGFVNPGTQVAIFLNGTDAASGQQFTRLLLEEVEVIAVGSTTTTQTTTTTAEGTQTTEQLPRTLMTLALEQKDAEKVLLGQSTDELAFAVLTKDSTINSGPGVTADDLFR